MKKEDILEKSRQENRGGDERERKVRLDAYGLAHLFVILICFATTIFEEIRYDISAYKTPGMMILFGTNTVLHLFCAVKVGKKYDWFVGIASLLLFVGSVFLYFSYHLVG